MKSPPNPRPARRGSPMWLADDLDTPGRVPTANTDVLSFLGALGCEVSWMHGEKLHFAGEEPQFTRALGE